MKIKDLETRVLALEEQVEQLRKQVAAPAAPRTADRWWETEAGRFANDPVFDEIVRLGREYRESLHPDRRKKKSRAKKNNGRA